MIERTPICLSHYHDGYQLSVSLPGSLAEEACAWLELTYTDPLTYRYRSMLYHLPLRQVHLFMFRDRDTAQQFDRIWNKP